MKYLLIIILLLISSTAFSQTTYYIRADSTKLQKIGANNELIIQNSTRTRTGAYLKNISNGITGFFYAVDSAYISGSNLVLVRGGGTQNVTVVIPGGSTPGLQAVITQDPVLTAGDNTISRVGDSRLKFQQDITSGSGNIDPALWVEQNISGTATSNDPEVGRFDLNISGTGTIGGVQATGVVTSLSIGAGKNIGVYSGFRFAQLSIPATSSVSVFEGISIDGSTNAGTVGDWYGFYYGGYENTGAGTTTNHYGLWIDTLKAAGTTNNYAIYTKNGDVRLGALPTGAATDSILTYEASTGIVRKRNVASITGVNIYNSDGTITGDRTVTGAGFDFTWNNAGNIVFNTTNSAGFVSQAGGLSGIISAGPGVAQLDADGTNKASVVILNEDSVIIRNRNDNGDTLSEIKVFKNKININPAHGVLLVDTLTFVPGTKALRYNPATGLVSYADTSTAAGGGATVALDNLSAVAINAALVLGTSDAFALGSATKQWSDLYLAEGGVINWDNGDALLTQAASNLTLTGADLTVSGGVLYSNTAGGIGSGVVATASGSSSYASIDYVNDASTRFQTGLYGSAASAPNKAFFYHAANADIGFTTNNLERLLIAGSGAITMSSLAGTGSRAVVADAAGVVTAPVSDRSVKSNINSLYSAIGKIMRLRPVTFEFKEGWKNHGEGVQVGFIAQEVADVLPNSVFITPSTGKMGFNSQDMIPLLVRAMQEQQQQIDQLKKEIRKLKRK